VAQQIEHCKTLRATQSPDSNRYWAISWAIFVLEQLIGVERRALLIAHSQARGMADIDPIAMLWFTNTFLPYAYETTNG
jgi:hypothetical protein